MLVPSIISDLSSSREFYQKNLFNLSVYEEYITDISVRAENFMKEKGIKALRKIGFKYISHSNHSSNYFRENRDYSSQLPKYFIIEIEIDTTKIEGKWKGDANSVVDIIKRTKALEKMIKDFEENTCQKIKIDRYTLQVGSSPMIQILFK